MRPPDLTLYDTRSGQNRPFREYQSGLMIFYLLDEEGVAIPGTAIDTATWTLYTESTGTVINSRSQVDFSSSIGTGPDAGLVGIQLTPDDMKIQGLGASEFHRLLLEFTWTDSVSKRGNYEIRIPVENLLKVPA